MRIFDPNKEPFISYGKEHGAQFINHPAVIRALECLRNGEPPTEFKWDYWMRPAGSRRTSQSNSPNFSFNRISHYPRNVDPIHEMNNDANDTEKQFRLYEYHITFQSIKVASHLTMKRVVCSYINQRKIMIEMKI